MVSSQTLQRTPQIRIFPKLRNSTKTTKSTKIHLDNTSAEINTTYIQKRNCFPIPIELLSAFQ